MLFFLVNKGARVREQAIDSFNEVGRNMMCSVSAPNNVQQLQLCEIEFHAIRNDLPKFQDRLMHGPRYDLLLASKRKRESLTLKELQNFATYTRSVNQT